jgi:choline kinase
MISGKKKCVTTAKMPKIEVVSKSTDLISIVLLCDSPGYRMKSYGPTSLISINGKKLIDLQIEIINRTFSNNEIIICAGFEIDRIIKYIKSKHRNSNIRIVENQLYNNSNSCEALRIAINNTFNDKVLIFDGSLLINHKCLSLIDTNTCCILIEKTPSNNLDVGVNVDENSNVQHFSYGAHNIWSEIWFMNNENIIDECRKIVQSIDYKNKFIFEAINELLISKYNIKAIQNKNTIEKINDIKTYHAMKGTSK